MLSARICESTIVAGRPSRAAAATKVQSDTLKDWVIEIVGDADSTSNTARNGLATEVGSCADNESVRARIVDYS